jgi:hypothetical protein
VRTVRRCASVRSFGRFTSGPFCLPVIDRVSFGTSYNHGGPVIERTAPCRIEERRTGGYYCGQHPDALRVDRSHGWRLWFPVLSDFRPYGEVARIYGVLRPDGAAERAPFVVDIKGTITYVARTIVATTLRAARPARRRALQYGQYLPGA